MVGILLLVFCLFIILMLFAGYTTKLIFQRYGDDFSSSGKEDKSISVVEIKGVIMESKSILELLHKAEKDKETKAIILRINSPGGAVGPTQEIYDEIRRIDNEYKTSKGKKGRPIYASFESVAASGGYYIAAATRKIFSNPGTITGSIGVLMEFTDLSQLLKWMKIKPQLIKAGRYKDTGSPSRPITAEERSLLNDVLKGVRRQFVNHIVEARGKRIKGNINEIAQGQIFSGQQALAMGLVDDLEGLYGAGRKIHRELKLKGEFGLKFIKKRKRSTQLLDLLDGLEGGLGRLANLVSQVPSLMFHL